jgi:hypothetical protein
MTEQGLLEFDGHVTHANQGGLVYVTLETTGWATMPGNDAPEKRIAKACANHILAINGSSSDIGRQ